MIHQGEATSAGLPIGECAAVLTSMLWVGSSLAFAISSRRIGVITVNLVRSLLALVGLMAAHAIVHHSLWPDLPASAMIMMALSGFIGLSIGDQFLFSAAAAIGARSAMLIMTSVPVIAAAMAAFLGESLGWLKIAGMAVTLGGIVWVILERPMPRAGAAPSSDVAISPPRSRRVAIFYGVVAALCQAAGMVLAHEVLSPRTDAESPQISTLAAQVVRMGAGLLGVIMMVALIGRFPPGRAVVRTLPIILVGTLTGPTLGVYFSLVAVEHAPVGIATTLMALTPVFILPFSFWIERERISPRAVIGALVSVAGVAMLMLDAGG